jgi:hypothetical protein
MTPNPSPPLLHRQSVRPVKRRTRTFRPNYLSFAGYKIAFVENAEKGCVYREK